MTISILLFALTIPSFIILGVDFSDFLISIDYCKEINNVVENNSPLTNKGIGYDLPCASKPTRVMINVAKYELFLSFNELISIANNTILNTHKIAEGLGPYKRNNEHFLDLIKKYNWEQNDPKLVAYINMIMSTNNILRELVALSECQVPTNIINYGEEKVCEKNLGYMFYNLSYLLAGIISLIVLSIEINKLTVILRMNGKKLGRSMGVLNELNE